MNICIVSPFNPISIVDYLYEDSVPKAFDNHCSSSSVNALVKGFLQLGHRVVVVTSCFIDKDILLKGRNIEVHILSSCRRGFALIVPEELYMAKRIKRVLSLLKNDVDVIHAQWAYMYALATFKTAGEVPTYCTVRDWCPFILSVQKGLKNKFRWSIKRIVFECVMRNKYINHVANSNYTHSCISKYNSKKVIPLIPNSVVDDFVLKEERKYPVDPVIISICQDIDEPRKNIKTLIMAFEKLLISCPSARLVLVGNYSLGRGSIYEMVIDREIESKVEFVGIVKHIGIVKMLDDASILVHPALEETFGNIFLEAWGRRVPVVGGINSGAVPQVLGEGKFGLLCDVESSDSLCNAMKLLIDDKTVVSSYIGQAYENLMKNYTQEEVALRHVRMYENDIRRKFI